MLNNQTWLVVADSSACKIYAYHNKPKKITLVKEIQHPENSLKDIDIAVDKHGSYRCNAGSGNFTASDPKQNHIEAFSREIAHFLNLDRKKHHFEHLILISPPHMGGLINQHFNKHTKKLLDMNINKSLIKYDETKLLSLVDKYTSSLNSTKIH